MRKKKTRKSTVNVKEKKNIYLINLKIKITKILL